MAARLLGAVCAHRGAAMGGKAACASVRSRTCDPGSAAPGDANDGVAPGKPEGRDGHPGALEGQVGAKQARARVACAANHDVLDRAACMRRASALPHFRPERGHRIDPGQEKDFEISRAQCGAEAGWRETMREVPVVASAEARRAPHAQCQYAIGNEYPREL